MIAERFLSDVPSWRRGVNVPFAMKDAFKELPGTMWHAEERVWSLPIDLREEAEEHLGVEIVLRDNGKTFSHEEGEWAKGLHPHQKLGVQNGLVTGSILLRYPTGAGKTPTAIRYCDAVGARTVLVVCPAIARGVWSDHIRDWSQGQVVVISKKSDWPKAALANARWMIVSYELFGRAENLPRADVLICDESHYLKNKDSGRTENVQIYSEYFGGKVLLLSGTPIANVTLDLWSQANIMFPGRWGSYWKWVRWYFHTEEVYNEGAKRKLMVVGELKRPEALKRRLGWISHAVNREDIAHLFPGVTYEVDVVPARRSKKRLQSILSGAAFDEKAFSEEVEALKGQKTEELFRHVDYAFESGKKHVCVLTHLRSSAADLGAQIGERFHCPVYVIDGALPADERHAVIRRCREESRAVLVCTMDSIGVAIDLTFCTYAVFAELHWSPGKMAQVCGRFDRLSGQEPATVVFLVCKGYAEEYVARALQRKLRQHSQLLTLGKGQEALSEAGLSSSEGEWKATIAEVAASYVEDAYD